MKWKTWMLVSSWILVAAAGAFFYAQLGSASAEPVVPQMTPEQHQAVATLKTFSDGFATVAESVIPAVVTITSEKVVRPAESLGSVNPWFRQFFGGGERRPFTQHGLGSGVIVDDGGYILTNNHVIRGADELTVILFDGRRIKAEVVGADERTDLAVLSIDAGDLPALRFGDSNNIRIGEWVLAIGSPFSENLQATVTSGIISATGRSLRLSEYENFIQTDAAINPGNSGGALINLDGELIGINSAIATRNGGSNGIGFAIPANLAQDIMQDLVQDGRVTRGWLGVGIQTVDQNLAEALGLDTGSGVLVTSVVAGGPAEQSGIQTEDVIVSFDGGEVDDTDALRLSVARTHPGTRADLTVIRDGRKRTFKVMVGEFPEGDLARKAERTEAPGDRGFGFTVKALTPDLARRLELDETSGLVITDVSPGSQAAEAGVLPGDVVRRVNKRPVHGIRDFRGALEGTQKGKPVLFQLERRGTPFFVAIRP